MADYGSFKSTNFRYLCGEMLDNGTSAPALLGGITQRFLSATTTLKFGDVVQVTGTAYSVATATTNLHRTVGVVVGGDVTNNEILTDSSLVGSMVVCSAAGASVIVQRSGIVQVALDTDDVTIGDIIVPSAITAGRVGLGLAGLVVTSGASTVFGSSSVASAAITGNILAKPVMGYTMTTETVAGNPIVVVLKNLI